MTDETKAIDPIIEGLQIPLPESPVVLPAGADATISIEATPSDVVENAPEEVHKILRNGLAILGKIEHFTEEELQKFTHWVAGRL